MSYGTSKAYVKANLELEGTEWRFLQNSNKPIVDFFRGVLSLEYLAGF